jgi:hypothetical protein
MDTVRTDNITEDLDVYQQYAIGRLKGGWEVVLFDEYGKEFMWSSLGKVDVESGGIVNSEPIDFGTASRHAIVSFAGLRVKDGGEVKSYFRLHAPKTCSTGDGVLFEVGGLIIHKLDV